MYFYSSAHVQLPICIRVAHFDDEPDEPDEPDGPDTVTVSHLEPEESSTQKLVSNLTIIK